MTLKEDIKAWLDPTGAVALHIHPQGRDSDNSALFTGTYYALLKLRGEATERDYLELSDFIMNYSIEQGLIARYPGSRDTESHDNYTGLAVACHLFGAEYHPGWFLRHGRAHRYSWNSEKPGVWTKGSFLLRFPWFVPMLRIASGEGAGFFGHVLISLCIWHSILFEDPNDVGAKILQWLKNHVFEGHNRLTDWTIRHWRNWMAKHHPDMASVFQRYFVPEHPFSKYAPKNF